MSKNDLMYPTVEQTAPAPLHTRPPERTAAMRLVTVPFVLFALSMLAMLLGVVINALHNRSDLLQIIGLANTLTGNAGLYLAVYTLTGLDLSVLTLLTALNILTLPRALYESWPIMHPFVVRACRALKPGAQNPWQSQNERAKVA